MHCDVDLRSRRMWAASYRLTRLEMNENSEYLESFCTGHARVRAERGVHQANLLTDDEMFALEDKLTDFIECRSSVTVSPGEMGAKKSPRKILPHILWQPQYRHA